MSGIFFFIFTMSTLRTPKYASLRKKVLIVRLILPESIKLPNKLFGSLNNTFVQLALIKEVQT